MADTGTVNASIGLNVRSGPGTNNSKVTALPNGAQVEITGSSGGWYQIKSGNTTGWVCGTYLNVEQSNTTANVSTSDATPVNTSTGGSSGTNSSGEDWEAIASGLENGDFDKMGLDEYYLNISMKYAFCLGAPFKYNMDIDIQYTDEVTPGYGRVVNKTILSNPSILMMLPGKAKMFPNLIGAEEDTFVKKLINAADGDVVKAAISEDDKGKFSGKLYNFIAETKEYTQYLNALCRACAIMLKIGDRKMPNTPYKLKEFDYSYWTIRKEYQHEQYDAGSNKSIFGIFGAFLQSKVTMIKNAATSDAAYINFFMNGSDTNVSESITNGVTDSPLSGIFDSVSSFASMLNYFTGSGFNVETEDVSAALKTALGGEDSTLGGLFHLGENFLKGGRMILPKMVEGAKYGKSISCNMKFVSPYGDPYSVFLKCIVPICHLLAMALPKQLSDNMYTFPFLVRASQNGCFNMDCGIISSLNITRGGSDDSCWTVDGLATEWDVQMELTPLVDDLMVTSADHPALFCKNENLLDYLANFCGFDVLAYNANTKWEMALSFIKNKIFDYPKSINNKLIDSSFNALNRYSMYHW